MDGFVQIWTGIKATNNTEGVAGSQKAGMLFRRQPCEAVF
jgi:hypothetical protein